MSEKNNDAAIRALPCWTEPVTIVFGHDDLLAANLIDDGQRLWLIDWDYAGFNSPPFDLANLASNYEFTPELESRLLSGYFGAGLNASIARGYLRRCERRWQQFRDPHG
jgi:thiamine kinase-like enzyme